MPCHSLSAAFNNARICSVVNGTLSSTSCACSFGIASAGLTTTMPCLLASLNNDRRHTSSTFAVLCDSPASTNPSRYLRTSEDDIEPTDAVRLRSGNDSRNALKIRSYFLIVEPAVTFRRAAIHSVIAEILAKIGFAGRLAHQALE